MQTTTRDISTVALIAVFPMLYERFEASLRTGKFSCVLEHDDCVRIAIELGKLHTMHKIVSARKQGGKEAEYLALLIYEKLKSFNAVHDVKITAEYVNNGS